MTMRGKRSMDGVRPSQKLHKLEVPNTRSDKKTSLPIKTSPSYTQGSLRKRNTFSYKKSSTSFIKRNWFWLNYVVKILGVGIIVIIFANTNEKTKISLTPHIEYLILEDSIQAYSNPKEGQLGFDIIAVTDEISIPLEAKGERPREEKATGTITIYNNYSSEPQRLLPQTRFESASGKIFYIGNEEVIIPGKEGETPGTIELAVTAEKPGEDYNIDITDFSIPGFKDAGLNEKYQSIYAVSTKKFTGGLITTEGFVDENQRIQTEQALRKQLSERLELRLSKENTEKVLIVKESAQLRFKESEFVSDADQQQGLLTQKGTIVALALSKESLGRFSVEHYLQVNDDEKVNVIDDRSVVVGLEQEGVDYTNLQTVALGVRGKLLLEWEIDREGFIYEIQGVPIAELASFLREINSIDTAHIDIFPPWNNHVSRTPDHIEMQVD